MHDCITYCLISSDKEKCSKVEHIMQMRLKAADNDVSANPMTKQAQGMAAEAGVKAEAAGGAATKPATPGTTGIQDDTCPPLFLFCLKVSHARRGLARISIMQTHHPQDHVPCSVQNKIPRIFACRGASSSSSTIRCSCPAAASRMGCGEGLAGALILLAHSEQKGPFMYHVGGSVCVYRACAEHAIAVACAC